MFVSQELAKITLKPIAKAKSPLNLPNWQVLYVWACGVALPASMGVAALLLARGLTAPAYGKVAYFFSILGLVILLGSLGVTTQVRTVAARYKAQPANPEILAQLKALFAIRLGSVLILGSIAGLIGLFGSKFVAAGIIAGVVVLTGEFFNGILQGLGRFVPGSSLQAFPAVLYLGTVVLSGVRDSNYQFVIVVIILSYLPSLLIAGVTSCWLLKINPLRLATPFQALRRIVLASGQVYLVGLALAFYGMFGAFVLGSLGYFNETSAFSLSLTIVSFPLSVFALVHSNLIYPRYCQLLAQNEPQKAALWFDQFYRLLAGGGLAVTVVVVIFAEPILTLFFTSKYAYAAPTLSALAPTVVLSLLGQLIIWSLVAYGQFRGSLAAAIVQLVGLAGGGLLAISLFSDFLGPFALAHTLATCLSLLVGAYYLRKLTTFPLHLRRFGLIVVFIIVIGLGVRQLFPAKSGPEIQFVELGLVSSLSLLAALAVSFFRGRLQSKVL